MSFYAKHSHHHRGIFVVTALGLAGLCSLFPVMCFKSVSSKEKERLRRDVADLEAQQKQDEKWIREHTPRPSSLRRSPSTKSSRRGGGGARRPPTSSPSTSALRVKAHKRPPLGPRTQTPPSWPPAAETVPPQLLGGRAGSDARGLRRHERDQAEDVLGSEDTSYFDASSTLQGRGPPQQRESSAANDQPAAQTESPSTSTDTVSSKGSFASSFAYLLRDRRSDKRLFHKRSQPPSYLQAKQPSAKTVRPAAIRTPSSTKPRIVEDTLSFAPHVASPIAAASPVSVLHSSQSTAQQAIVTPREPSPSPSANTREHSGSSHSSARQVRSYSPLQSNGLQRPGLHATPRLHASDSTLDQKAPARARKGLQIDLPTPFPRLGRTDTLSEATVVRPSVDAYHRLSVTEAFPREAGPFTPMEFKINSPRIAHGDHYFRTFGEDTVYEKPRLKSLPKIQPDAPAASEARKPSVNTATVGMPSSQRPLLHREDHQKHRRHLLALRRLPLTDSALRVPPATPGSPSPLPYDPAKSFLALSRHTRTSNRSDGSASSYFGIVRRKQNSSDQSVMTPSPLQAHWTPSATSTHARERSSPLSPLTVRPPRLRWSHNLEISRSEEIPSPADGWAEAGKRGDQATASDAANIAQAVPPQLHYISSDGKRYPATSLTAADAPNFLPSEMKRIDTPPLKEANARRAKLRAFRSFFFDSSSLPAEESSIDKPRARKSGLLSSFHGRDLSRKSLSSLIPRGGWSWLLDSPSQSAGVQSRRASDPLEVTDFQQTPYSQRYGDARRAKETQMRAYIWNETLREDDDSTYAFGSAGNSFELSIPDHLTNSPLCPLNEKHKSGGKAICPIHGRKRMSVNAYPRKDRAGTRSNVNRGGHREPTIVFESEKPEYNHHGMDLGEDSGQ